MTARTRLTAAALAAAALALTAAAGTAQAADGGPQLAGRPTAADLAAARRAAADPHTHATLGRFFARDGVPPGAGAAPSKREAAAAAAADPKITGDPVPVYVLDPGFVAGRAGAPVARLSVVAAKAVSADGSAASVWTAKVRGAWRVVNIATGSPETQYGAGHGAAFEEPQVRAWYALRGGRVRPLNAAARSAVGAGGVTVAAYRARVHRLYGKELPGSAYAKRGLAGGSRPAVSPSSPGGFPWWLLGAPLVLLAGAAVARRRLSLRR